MRHGNKRDKYGEDIALCMGFDTVEELDADVQDLLRIESPARLEVILQIAEMAAINCQSYVMPDSAASKLEAIERMARAHNDSKTKGVRDLMEDILVIIEEKQRVEKLPVNDDFTFYDPQLVEELADVS